MIAEKGREGAEEDPTRAKWVSCYASIAANVAAHHGNLVERNEFLQLGNSPPVMVPISIVVSQPVANFAAGAREG